MIHAAIKTTHLGINFRSRLEAKYAQLFTNLGFKWQYEPEDLPGWIPDFVLYGAGGRKMYVEIKPATSPYDLMETFSKINKALPDYNSNVALLTSGFYVEIDNHKIFTIGYIRVKEKHNDVGYHWDHIALKEELRSFDFSDLYQNWVNRLSGEHSKNFSEDWVLQVLFQRASNQVQWKQ